MKCIRQQGGFGLIEALLALFILTIGILGVAGLQTQGMRSSNMALQRTIVVMKTQEIIERMRANKESLVSYAGGAADGSCNTSGTVCSGATLAAHDLYLWQTELNRVLPSVTNTDIVVTPPGVATEPSTVSITTTWSDREDDNLTYSVTVRI